MVGSGRRRPRRNIAIDVRPGGRWRTTMRLSNGSEHTVSGIYRTIEPPKRLVFTWGWDDDAGVRVK